MRDLREMSIGQRVVLSFVIVLTILFALALFGFLTGEWDQAEGQTVPTLTLLLPPSKWDGEMLELDRQAVRDAYTEKIKQLFTVWVRESGSYEHGERAMKGATQARRVYIEAMQALERREQMQNEPRN